MILDFPKVMMMIEMISKKLKRIMAQRKKMRTERMMGLRGIR